MNDFRRKLCIMVATSLLVTNFIPENHGIATASSITYQDRTAREQRMKEAAQHRESQKTQRETNNNSQRKTEDQKADNTTVAPSKQEENKTASTPTQPSREKNVYLNNTSPTNNLRIPSPMTFQEAERYSKRYPNDITYHTTKIKDRFGNKNRDRIFDFLNEKGLYHSGSTITGVGDTSAIRFSVDYGFENISSTPVASVGWLIGSTGNWGSFWPKFINFVFDEGDTITIPLGNVNHDAEFNSGLFVTSVLSQFHGIVILTPQNLYALSNHRQLQSAYISDGSGALVHLFYSGEKDKKEKSDMMRGFHHACKMLDVDYETVTNLTRLQQKTIEEQERFALVESVKKEIERDKLKEEILAEMNAK